MDAFVMIITIIIIYYAKSPENIIWRKSDELTDKLTDFIETN